MSIAICLAYCFGVSPKRFASATCVGVSVTFLGAVLRVAGATTLDFFSVFRLVHQHPRIDREILVACENLCSRSIHCSGVYPEFDKFRMQPQRKTCHFIVLSEPRIGRCPIVSSFIDGCWGGLFYIFPCLYRSFNSSCKVQVLSCLTYPLYFGVG
jgi:hypothetical protein